MSFLLRLLARVGLYRAPAAPTGVAASAPDAQTAPPDASMTTSQPGAPAVSINALLAQQRLRRSAAEEQRGPVPTLETLPGAPSIEEAYTAAGLRELAGGWSIERLAGFVADLRQRGRPAAEIAERAQAALAKDGLALADLRADGQARDEALVTFERGLAERAKQAQEVAGQTVAELRRRIEELERQAAANQTELEVLANTLAAWEAARRQRSALWAEALAAASGEAPGHA